MASGDTVLKLTGLQISFLQIQPGSCAFYLNTFSPATTQFPPSSPTGTTLGNLAPEPGFQFNYTASTTPNPPLDPTALYTLTISQD